VTAEIAATVALARCEYLNRFSAHPSRLERAYLTPQHRGANELVEGWLRELGMQTWTDSAGNQWGRIEGAEPGLPALVLGSHLDTVPDGGSYDGMLGVAVALAVVEGLRDRIHELPFALEIVGFSDHEGTRFATPMLGSSAVAGLWDDDWWDLRDQQGATVLEAFRQWGLDPRRIGEAARQPQDLVGFLEAHVESGTVLEAAGKSLGVVTSTASVRRYVVNLVGEARHGGGTAHRDRKDALVGASLAIAEIDRLATNSEGTATVGQINVLPGGVNVIVGRADFSVEVRHRSDKQLEELWAQISAAVTSIAAERGLRAAWGQVHDAPAVDLSGWLQDCLSEALVTTGEDEPLRLAATSAHDASALAAITDVAMLLIRSVDGNGHHPAEDVRAGDVASAIATMTEVVWAVAR